MCAKAAGSRICGGRPWPCSPGMKDLEGGIGVEKGPAVQRMRGWDAGLGGH